MHPLSSRRRIKKMKWSSALKEFLEETLDDDNENLKTSPKSSPITPRNYKAERTNAQKRALTASIFSKKSFNVSKFI